MLYYEEVRHATLFPDLILMVDERKPEWFQNMHEEDEHSLLTAAQQSRRAFCGSAARFTIALTFFPLAELFTSCDSQQQQNKKKIRHPSVQINSTDVITNTRYIGNAFAFPEQMVSASLEPKPGISAYVPGISFLGMIAQDTLSFGYNRVNPRDIILVGMFKQKNGTFRYGYEINGVRGYAKGHALSSHFKYVITFQINEEGRVADPDYPHQRRFGYDFQITNGWDGSIWLKGLKSSATFANQLFVGVMDEGNNVHLPDNKKLQFYISVSGTEQVPGAIYKNEDDTSQVSSQYSDSENDIVLTLTGSS